MKTARKTERNHFPVLLVTILLFIVGMINEGWCNTTTKTAPAKKTETAINQGAEKVKSKFHEVTDNITKEKAHESIDQVADYLDADKLKERVDEVADYLDKEKIKDYIDYVADHLDRDQIKQMIDFVAEAIDRDKIKEAIDFVAESIDRDKVKDIADQAIGSIDKERIKGKFDKTVDQVAGGLQEATHALEQKILQAGNNKTAVADILKNYNWRQYIHDSTSYGPATLSNLKLGAGNKPVALVKPGQEVNGEVVCFLDPKECASFGLYRVVLGLKNKGGQTTIFNHFGLRAGKETDRFTLVAPKEKGVYEVAFRVVEAAREGTALKLWDDKNKNGGGEPVTVGLLIVN